MRYSKSVLLAALGSLVFAAPALADSVAPPAGAAPLRYRDVIFPTLTVTPGLTYGSAPDGSGNPVALTLDMYRPSGDMQTSRPAIVLVHGGGFTGGNSKNGAMVTMAKGLAQRGYVRFAGYGGMPRPMASTRRGSQLVAGPPAPRPRWPWP